MNYTNSAVTFEANTSGTVTLSVAVTGSGDANMVRAMVTAAGPVRRDSIERFELIRKAGSYDTLPSVGIEACRYSRRKTAIIKSACNTSRGIQRRPGPRTGLTLCPPQ
jgi:hypothetical protein